MEMVNFLYLAGFYLMANVAFFLFIRLPLAVKLASGIELCKVAGIDSRVNKSVDLGEGRNK